MKKLFLVWRLIYLRALFLYLGVDRLCRLSGYLFDDFDRVGYNYGMIVAVTASEVNVLHVNLCGKPIDSEKGAYAFHTILLICEKN